MVTQGMVMMLEMQFEDMEQKKRKIGGAVGDRVQRYAEMLMLRWRKNNVEHREEWRCNGVEI